MYRTGACTPTLAGDMQSLPMTRARYQAKDAAQADRHCPAIKGLEGRATWGRDADNGMSRYRAGAGPAGSNGRAGRDCVSFGFEA
jgi:hypothetical protein